MLLGPPAPAWGQRRGTSSGAGSCATRRSPAYFPIAHRAVVSAARALPGSGAVTLSAGWSSLDTPWEGWGDSARIGPISPQAGLGAGGLFTAKQPKSCVKHPLRHWGARGCGMGLGFCCKEQEPLGRGKGWEGAGHGATPGGEFKKKTKINIPPSLWEGMQAAHQPSSLSHTRLPASPSSLPTRGLKSK